MTQPQQPYTAESVANLHQYADTDSSSSALHHTLGPGDAQATSGTHNHDGRNSRILGGVAAPDTVKRIVGQSGQPTFQGSWVQYSDVNYAGAEFRRVAGGLVVMRGLIMNGTIGTTAFTLPVGYRPKINIILPAATNTGYGELRINADGTVVPTSGGTGWFSIASTFYGEQ